MVEKTRDLGRQPRLFPDLGRQNLHHLGRHVGRRDLGNLRRDDLRCDDLSRQPKSATHLRCDHLGQQPRSE